MFFTLQFKSETESKQLSCRKLNSLIYTESFLQVHIRFYSLTYKAALLAALEQTADFQHSVVRHMTFTFLVNHPPIVGKPKGN